MSKIELRPCKCGCQAELAEGKTFEWCLPHYVVRCTNPDCDNQTLKYPVKAEAIEAWNGGRLWAKRN
jgi:hypothetical protein